MLIHVTPRFFTCPFSGDDVDLVDLQIEELGLVLKGGSDLAARRPFRNKRYVVGCRKAGKKAIAGILIETPMRITRYTAVTRWAVDAEFIVTHRVEYLVLDEDFDSVTDCMTMWYAASESLGGWQSRWPDIHKDAVPACAQPRMQLSNEPQRTGVLTDFVRDGLILQRSETFAIPTIERDRLLFTRPTEDRRPAIESAFVI